MLASQPWSNYHLMISDSLVCTTGVKDVKISLANKLGLVTGGILGVVGGLLLIGAALGWVFGSALVRFSLADAMAIFAFPVLLGGAVLFVVVWFTPQAPWGRPPRARIRGQ